MQYVLGVDLGGTKVAAGLVSEGEATEVQKVPIRSKGNEQEVLQDIYGVLDKYDVSSVRGIGVGVPGTVDASGVIFDIQNIPSWKEVPLKSLLEERYDLPVHINNDSNCFALGERHFGKGRSYDNFAGVTIGTGLGTGIIINGQLYDGAHVGAGEFGMIPYRDHVLEYYASGSFFANVHGVSGFDVYQLAHDGDPQALTYYRELGHHLGEALKILMFAIDPQAFILGGSVVAGYDFFKASMMDTIAAFPYRNVLEGLTVEVSDMAESAILGAAALAVEVP